MVTLISHKDCSQPWTSQIKRLWQNQADLRTSVMFLMPNNFKFVWTKTTWRTYSTENYLRPTFLFPLKTTHFHKNRDFHLTLLFCALEELKAIYKSYNWYFRNNEHYSHFIVTNFLSLFSTKRPSKVGYKGCLKKKDKSDDFKESEINNELKSQSRKQKKQEPTTKFTQRIHYMHIWKKLTWRYF